MLGEEVDAEVGEVVMEGGGPDGIQLYRAITGLRLLQQGDMGDL